MIKVLYDNKIFNKQVFGGISRYFCELYHNPSGYEPKLELKYTNNKYLLEKNKRLLIPRVHDFIEANYFKGHTKLFRGLDKFFNLDEIVKQDLKLIEAMKNGLYDLLHPTYYDRYFLKYIGDKPFVLTVYDMIYEIYSQDFSASQTVNNSKRELCKKANRIIAISENTKRDLIRFFNIDQSKIDVIYLGNSLDLKSLDANVLVNMSIPDKYILYTGARALYKNFNFFIKSIAEILLRDRDLYLVCTGGAFTKEEKKFINDLGLNNKIIQLFADDEQLACLYKNAQAFVFPSLYEGFGIPVLEAFACGCPALLSDRSSLPEVGGAAALYFDPENSDSIKNAVEKVLQDDVLRDSLIRAGKERVKLFTWEKCAEETRNVYEKAIR